MATGLGAILGVVAAIISLWPDPPKPPDVMSADLSTPVVADQSMSLGHFLISHLRLDPKSDADQIRTALTDAHLPASLTDDQLRTDGYVVVLSAEFKGLNGKSCPFFWTLYDAATGQQLPSEFSDYVDQPGYPNSAIIPAGPDDKTLSRMWIPRPPRAGPFFVRIEVFNTNGSRRPEDRLALKSADSAPFG